MTPPPAGLVIFGFGGHARSIADVALAAGIPNLVFVDAAAQPGGVLLGFPVLSAPQEAPPDGWQYFPGAGDNVRRQAQLEHIQAQGWPLATIISPRSTIGVGAEVGTGTFVGHHSHVGPLAKIGVGCIVNTGAAVEHDCQIGRFSHVSVNATVAGKVDLGEFVFIGAGATVINGCTVDANIIVGAGAVVTTDLRKRGTYVGAPARIVAGRD